MKKKNKLVLTVFLGTLEIVILLLGIFSFLFFNAIGKKDKNTQRLTAASMDHSAWITNGKLHIAGEKYEGQEQAEKWKNLEQVAISDDHLLALDKHGEVYAIGSNSSLQCEINGQKNVIYIETGLQCSIAVMDNGTVKIYGVLDESWQKVLLQEEKVMAVSIGDRHFVVLYTDGKVAAYGDNANGQCDVQQWKDITKVMVGYDFTVGLTKEGNVLFAGNKGNFQDNSLTEWKDITGIAAGSDYIVAVDKFGFVYAAGDNRQGQCDVSNWHQVESIAAGYDHTVALGKNNELLAAGYNGNGQCNGN